MDRENVKNGKGLKAVEIKTVVKKRMKNLYPSKESKFKCVVIDDKDDEDETVDLVRNVDNREFNQQPKKLIINVNSPLENCVTRERQSKEFPFCNPSEIVGEAFQIRESIQSFNGKINITKNLHDDPSIKNIPVEDSITENLIGEGFETRELEQVFNERVKVNYPSNNEHSLTIEGESKECENLNISSSSDEHECENMTMKNFTSSDVIDKKCTIIETDKDVKCFPTTSNEDVVIGKEIYPEECKEGMLQMCNMGIKNGANMLLGKIHNDAVENDVIAEAFKTGERKRVWELMKTKQHAPQQKKVIFPVVVKDNVTRYKENDENKLVDDSVNKTPDVDAATVSPLLQFQISLQNQIKDLVTTIQDLHTAEKDVIINTLTSKQQSTNKELLESLIGLLIEKTSKLQDKSCDQQESTKSVIQQEKLLEKAVDHASVASSQFVNNKPCDVMETAKPMGSNHGVINVGGNIVRNNHKAIHQNTSVTITNKNIDSTKRNAPHFSILKTPIRRRKAPLPFSEKLTIENEVVGKQIPAPLQMSECGFALLHEILKDCSTSLENKQDTPKVANYPEQYMNNIDLISGMQENKGDKTLNIFDSKDRRNDNTSVTINDPTQICENGTNLNYGTLQNQQNKSLAVDNSGNIHKDAMNFKNSVLENKCYNNPQVTSNLINNKCSEMHVIHDSSVTSIIGAGTYGSSQYIDNNTHIMHSGKYNCTTKLSLDERLSKLRQNFINSENQWLYQSKENHISSDTTLQNAEKVLKEAQVTSKMLESDDYFKYTDRNGMFNYFEANPYLVEPDVLRIKKNVDENIKQIKNDVPTKINNQRDCGRKCKRLPLKEKNMLPSKFR